MLRINAKELKLFKPNIIVYLVKNQSMKKLLILAVGLFFWHSALFAQDYKIHRVKKGETITEIAKQYGVSEEAIYKMNPDAKTENISAKTLVIPTGDTKDKDKNENATKNVVRFKDYRVQKKETLYHLAKENGIRVKDLKKYNPYLEKEELGEGDVIQIPIFTEKKTVNYNQSIQNSSFKNLQHIVLPKEGKYRIAKKYGMTIEELEKMNPEMGQLQPGQVLRVSNPNASSEKFRIYKVQPKDTYYSLTKRFNTSKEAMEELNPILTQEGLEAGMELKIPEEEMEGAENQMVEETIKKINLENHLTNFETKKVAVMLPFNLQKFDRDSVNKAKQIKSDRVLRISLDFYSGVLAAIDSVKKMGIPVKAQVFDTQQSKSKIDQIFDSNNFDDFQLVIGPLLTTNIAEATRRLSSANVPVLSPLTGGDLKESPNLFQTRPTDYIMEETLIAYIDSTKAGKNILILADKKHQRLAQKIKSAIPSARIINQANAEYLQRSDLTKYLKKDQKNWIVLEADDYGLVSNATSYLNSMVRNYDIRLFTTEKNDIYEEEVSNRYLSNLHFTYTSIAKEYDVVNSNTFMKTYHKNYGIFPGKYAVRGFDLTFDALLRLASANDFYDAADRKGTTEYVENKFNYQKKTQGGYYNKAVYLIEYQKGMKLKVIH